MAEVSNQEILEKAIEKAEKNGWTKNYKIKMTWLNDDGSRRITAKVTVDDWDTFAPIIFDHDFAKALWGEEPYAKVVWPHPDYNVKTGAKELVFTSYWQYHLQRMSIAENPIKYLAENI